MASEAPPFWWEPADWRAWCLAPFSTLYGVAAAYRLASGRRAPVAAPVLCIGNFTVGGEGKTPVAIALAKQARKAGRKPGFLSRGHGGSLSKPHLVDAEHDSARLVGDEPLLLARCAPTVVTQDRAAGARHLIGAGCDFIVMDDGFQSARIRMDYALMVVDARRGLGNGHVIPGGPLRAPLIDQLRHADALLTMGEGEGADHVVRQASRAGKPVFEARLKPRGVRAVKGRRFLAFAGIGNPGKFFDSLRGAGAAVVETRSFPDHHPFDEEDVRELRRSAEAAELALITTEKDLVRLGHGSAALQDFAADCQVLPVDAAFAAPDMAGIIVDATIAAWRERSLR
ncbi:tetraacyldisaccharide 4'-kinase [Nitratireductor pacificus]|uniref:Tetraacyldisaccharide 4'-kinase n=1 Tax=Nitratireductor pacificus pht-3B TaxID=391937 RepID=K2MK94_9HYPH|nr:tetraacyldisaccharide 4'-kinase [Nitratireductor pacificus]EKF17627.1 lipid-A-disaccharide synthase [Nitratireductor pacificus pht-3B]